MLRSEFWRIQLQVVRNADLDDVRCPPFVHFVCFAVIQLVHQAGRPAGRSKGSGGPGMLRTFFAVKIAPPPGLRRLHERLAGCGERLRPVALDNLHVTLKFLGDIPEERVSEICSVVRPIAEAMAASPVKLCGLRAFPHARRPSVVWVGFEQAERLVEIAGALDRALSPLGFVPEARPFEPHLTLLRVKSRPPEKLLALLARESCGDVGMVTVEEIEFLQSELARDGARYARLAVFSLRGV